MMRRGSRVVSSVSTPLSAAKRMTLWNMIQRADSETARVLARELPVEDQLRASVARNAEDKAVAIEQPISNIIARVDPAPLALAPTVPEAKYQLLRETYAKGCSDLEFELFVDVCNRLQLDPFKKQIYAIRRWDPDLGRHVMQPQASIGGMRARAERTGKYAGQSDPEWCGPDGVWKDVWLAKQPPAAARVRVYRSDWSHHSPGLALYTEYVQFKKDGSPARFWLTMPSNQLAKCAEAAALRKAFPDELSGVYATEEMGQADNEPQVVSAPPARAVAAVAQAPAQPTKPRTEPPPPPAAKPPQQQMQEKVDGPRFSAAFPIRAWADKPMRIAPIEVIADYIAYCEGVLSDSRRATHHKRAAASKAQAEAIYQEAAGFEMQRIVDQEERTAPIEPDAIQAGLQAEYDRMHRAQANLQDETDSWVNR